MSSTRAQFVKVKCPDCGGEQVAFNRPASTVACLVCGATLISPTGGHGRFKAEITQKLD